MSLDCYPFGVRRTIDLREQPIALDVAYDENLLITVIDDCRAVVVFDLKQTENNTVGRFKLGEDIVIDKVIYSRTGDYIALVGHNNGKVGLYTAFGWRELCSTVETKTELTVEELDLRSLVEPLDKTDRSEKLTSIDVCQKTGNLAANYGDLVVIYQLDDKEDLLELQAKDRAHHNDSQVDPPWSQTDDLIGDFEAARTGTRRGHFRHLVSVKLSMWVTRVALLENYLSVMAIDHVQVIRLEVLTLQIQPDSLDGDGSLLTGQQQVNRSAGSSGESHQAAGMMMVARQRNGSGVPSAADETTVSGNVSASESGGSIMSGMTSNQSTRTNFSSFLATDNEELLVENSAATSSSSALSSNKGEEFPEQEGQIRVNNATTDSDMTVITINNSNLAEMDQRQQQQQIFNHQQQQLQLQLEAAANSQDDCITWNLNTKKLVKLPTLMHNTSTDLASFHICHPLELLGPASESIACRVSARIYSANLSQNQLEPVVLLCKQFDFDRDPVKLAQLEAVYLDTHLDEQKRLNRASALISNTDSALMNRQSSPDELDESLDAAAGCRQRPLLKSRAHDQLAAVCCFVSTLTNCFIYSLTGKKVARIQTITHPGLCLDLRADLLNVYLLTPLGLQVCSTSICDTAFRHDWSSSADLNLSFVACNRARVLATKNHLVMVSSSSLSSDRDESNHSANAVEQFDRASDLGSTSFVEVLEKPQLAHLQERIVQTVQCCQSISIRSNLLTYLQTTAQFELIELEKRIARQEEIDPHALSDAIDNMRTISLMLARQMLQKKQTNELTNGRIDKTIKHLLDNSYCDLAELMRRHEETLDANEQSAHDAIKDGGLDEEPDQDRTLAEADSADEEEEEEEEEAHSDGNFELLRIFLRHTKFNQPILEYLKSLIQHGVDEKQESPTFNRVVAYMFAYNPRLLIKCAQRVTRELPVEFLRSEGGCLEFLLEQLRELVKLNSTGINRATVLFTLANLYHEMAAAVDQDSSRHGHLHEQCLSALSQIKPLNHLAITMCSNHEIIGRSMAKLVHAHYPQVFKLFLNQLQKRDELLAACDFERLVLAESALKNQPSNADELSQQENGQVEVAQAENDQSDDEEELFEQKLRLLEEISPVELAEFFCREADEFGSARALNQNDKRRHKEAVRAYLKASINVMESKFILARLCENSR